MKNLIFLIPVIFFFNSSCDEQPLKEAAASEALPGNTVTLSEAQFENAGIQTGRMEVVTVSSSLNLNGKIEVPPQNLISINVPTGGFVKSTKLLPGMPVRKGEILAIMEDPQFIQLQEDYLTAKARYVFNEKEFARQKELNVSKATSDKVYEQAKVSYETQYILMKSLEKKLEFIGLNPEEIDPDDIARTINIHSPVDGYVSAVNVNTGKYINPSDVLFELIDPEDRHLSLTVFDQDVHKLEIGQQVSAYTNSAPDKKYSAEIILISRNIANNAAEVHCHFRESDTALLPGMFMNARIKLGENRVDALPEEAIVRFENKNYVFLERNNRVFEITEVMAGVSENGFTEILNAQELIEENIVTHGAYNLLMVLKNIGDD